MAILYGFLRNWGTTLVATLVIPVTVLVTFVAMWIVGLSFDLMTLGGVAAELATDGDQRKRERRRDRQRGPVHTDRRERLQRAGRLK